MGYTWAQKCLWLLKNLAFIIYLRTILSKNYYTSYNIPKLFSKFSDPLKLIHILKKKNVKIRVIILD